MLSKRTGRSDSGNWIAPFAAPLTLVEVAPSEPTVDLWRLTDQDVQRIRVQGLSVTHVAHLPRYEDTIVVVVHPGCRRTVKTCHPHRRHVEVVEPCDA